jgi:hypothetical protein
MDNLPIVLIVVAVVAALVYVLFFRKKALPGEGAEKAPEAREQGPRSKGERSLGPSATPTTGERPRGKPPVVESLPSTDVLPD